MLFVCLLVDDHNDGRMVRKSQTWCQAKHFWSLTWIDTTKAASNWCRSVHSPESGKGKQWVKTSKLRQREGRARPRPSRDHMMPSHDREVSLGGGGAVRRQKSVHNFREWACASLDVWRWPCSLVKAGSFARHSEQSFALLLPARPNVPSFLFWSQNIQVMSKTFALFSTTDWFSPLHHSYSHHTRNITVLAPSLWRTSRGFFKGYSYKRTDNNRMLKPLREQRFMAIIHDPLPFANATRVHIHPFFQSKQQWFIAVQVTLLRCSREEFQLWTKIPWPASLTFNTISWWKTVRCYFLSTVQTTITWNIFQRYAQ